MEEASNYASNRRSTMLRGMQTSQINAMCSDKAVQQAAWTAFKKCDMSGL